MELPLWHLLHHNMELQEWIDGAFEETDTDYTIAGMNILYKEETEYLKKGVKLLCDKLHPSSVLEFGFGMGWTATEFQEQGIKLDAIVLDYLNLMHSPIGNNSYERIKHVTEQVRAMSYLFNCPIISATQLNRAGFDTDNPDLATISESIGLAATADAIISIFQNEEDRGIGIIRLGMMKNRYGPRGMTQAMRIDYSTLTIEQADDIEIDEGMDDTLNMLAGLAS